MIVDPPRIELQKRSASVIDMLTEFATNELGGMEGKLVGRCKTRAQQQALRVSDGPDIISLDFVSLRWPSQLQRGMSLRIRSPVATIQQHSARTQLALLLEFDIREPF